MAVKHCRAFAFLLVLVLLAACQPLPEENPTPTPIPTPASSSKPVYEVKRGSIVDQLKLLGRVAAVQEQQLYFKVGGRVKTVNVQLNQKVTAGTVLAQLETGQLETQIKQAQISLDIANLRLQQAKSKEQGVDLLQSEAEVRTAEAALETAQANLQKLQSATGDTDIQTAEANVNSAKAALQDAQAKLNQAKTAADSNADSVKTAEAAVATAQTNLDSANAKLEQAKRNSSNPDLAAARAAVATAQANLEVAKNNYQEKIAKASPSDFDALILAKNAESAQVQLDYLKASMEDQTIRAPFDGIVTQISSTAGGKPGDQVQAFAVIFTMANPQNIEVAVDMNESDVAKIGLGMAVTMSSDRMPGKTLTGKVRALPGDIVRPPNSRPQIRISFDQVPNLDIGGLINVTITAQKKDNVLLVPNSTIRSFAGRRYVQVVDSSGRKREVDVEVGIQGATDTEIVQGLKEGDKVLGQ